MTRIDFERLFEASPVQLMVLAPDPPLFTILAATDAYVRAVHKPREELVGRPVFEALPVGPEDRSAETATRASFQRAIDLRVPDTMAVQRHDLERPSADGGGFETRYWSPVNTPLLDEDGRVVCIIHRVEDVTEFVQAKQKEAEQRALTDELRTRTGAMEAEIYQRARQIQEANEKLRRANEELGELDRAKTVFFSNVSHELRTPLTLILGPLEELLRRNDLPPGTITELTVVRRNALRLTKLVNALLDFSRIEAGRARASYQPTDVGTLTAELASSFQSACEKAGLRLVIDSPPCSTPVHVDREMWEKIVLNLVSNAFKFTLEGEIEVKVRERGRRCELSVRDTGSGIPAEELPRVFERFHRVPSTRGRSLEGTGIGLSLVQELVKLHGGEVTVRSTLGQGSTFTVRVPLGTAHLPADRLDTAPSRPGTSIGAKAFADEASRWIPAPGGSVAAQQPAGAGSAASDRPAGAEEPARARVLLAEDNADMRDYVARLLEPTLEVLTVADGREAFEMAGRVHPDLVLTDVMIPRLDGVGLVRELRADPRLRATPVILLSARADEGSTGEGLEAGADDYLVKPFSARELVARVTTNLRLARMRTEATASGALADALRENDRRKDEFLAMLSHELRNPLAPIRNSLFVLERATPGGERARRAQQVIERQVAHLTRMVEELLDVSRITQGKMQVQAERVELDDLVRRVVEDARATFDERRVTLRCELPREPLVVSGDPTRLAQVVANLLGNAAKFTAPGGHCWLSLSVPDDETAVLSVRDDGPGMDREVLDSLFRPFVQADRTLHRSPGGLGLGLAIVKGVVDAHGGTVEARSEGPGRGAELVVRLPLLERPRPHLSVVPPAPRGQRLRVLIVEDNEDAAASLKEALELEGHEVEVAGDGETGLEKARAWRPDAIVSDIGLPRVDGYGVARAVRADPALEGTCLVAITGYAAIDDVRRSREAGFDHHISKPPDLVELGRILSVCEPGADADVSRR